MTFFRTTDHRLLFWAKVTKTESCWLWTGALSNGYSSVRRRGTSRPGHRIAYEELVGPIPDGLHLDHLCHSASSSCRGGRTCMHRRCVNPAHLEPVTVGENNRRGVATRVGNTCKHGHSGEWSVRPGDGHRYCRACNRERARMRSAFSSRAAA